MHDALNEQVDGSHPPPYPPSYLGPAREPLFPRSPSILDRTLIEDVLDRFPPHLIGQLIGAGIKILPLNADERYIELSRELRRLGVDVDAWPVPAAGLFVVAERTLYLRKVDALTVGHELGHALDCALGGGVYHSGYDRAIRDAFRRAREFVTPYSACGLDEYFAEAVRAYCEINDPGSPWPRVSRERLRTLDPAMHAIMTRVFAPPVS